MTRRRQFGLGVGAVVVAIAIWQLLANSVAVSPLFPSAWEVLHRLVTDKRIVDGLGVTVLRSLVGFAMGSAAGTIIGLAMGSVPAIRRFLTLYVNFFRFVTPIAWAAPAVIWFGFGNTPIVFLVFYTTVFIVIVNVLAGVTNVKRDRVRMATALGASRWDIFRHIIAPSTAGFAIVGMRIAMGNSVASAISAEMVLGRSGLGYVAYNARLTFDGDVMFACIVVLGVVGFCLDRLFTLAQRRLLWRFDIGR
jgi:NitT/TauT family transport system permease protein